MMLRKSIVSVSRSAARGSEVGRRTLTCTSVSLNKSGEGSTRSTSDTATESSTPSTSSTSSTSSTPSPSTSTTPSPTKPLIRETSTSPDALNTLPLPYLSFPIGVPTPPSASSPSWSETRDRLTSSDYRLASRQAIVKEATRGYFHDFHAIRSHGGKTWRAPTTLIRSDRALYFPRFSGTRLSDKAKTNTVDLLRGKISIVALLGSKISEEHTKSFFSDTIEQYATHPKFQLVQINLQTNPLKSYLVGLFLSSLKQQIDQRWWAGYLLSSDNIELLKDQLGYHNKHVGYTYLVDEKGRVRWAGGAFAEEGERKSLTSCTGVLLDRVGEEAKPNKGKKK